jgi:tetratricopeptide (TPR) repeat protein
VLVLKVYEHREGFLSLLKNGGERNHVVRHGRLQFERCRPRVGDVDDDEVGEVNGRKTEAEAAFRAATRADPMFAEAWYNLSDLLDEQGRSEAAIDCLRRALKAAPDYADAIFNLALLLQRNNKHEEAGEYWRRYLANDAQSEMGSTCAPVFKIL